MTTVQRCLKYRMLETCTKKCLKYSTVLIKFSREETVSRVKTPNLKSCTLGMDVNSTPVFVYINPNPTPIMDFSIGKGCEAFEFMSTTAGLWFPDKRFNLMIL